jgi:NAD(P)-dependent dehydrogenase (short-subunit alcohol dehydrogenase family)
VLGLDVAVPFRVVQALLGMLESAARPGDPARVVNMGSVDGYAVGPFDNFAYPAAKAALHHLTRVLAFRLAGRGITANCIAAGPVQTKMTQGLLDSDDGGRLSANPLGRLVGPDDLAGALVFLTARSGAFVTGAVVPVDGGAGIATWGMRAE